MQSIADASVESDDRFFKELADYAPVMIWRSGTDKLCDWFNKPWLDFVGRTMEQELGNGWVEGVHKDDVDRCLKIYTTSVDARERFSMIYRLRRHDGEYRQILDNGTPFNRGGIFAGYFGSCIDVTDQQAAEARLREAQKIDAIGKLTGEVDCVLTGHVLLTEKPRGVALSLGEYRHKKLCAVRLGRPSA